MSSVRDKVQHIFERLAGERAAILKAEHYPSEINDRITSALLAGGFGSDNENPVRVDEIGFHLVDWNSDAAFIVAMLLFPDEFTDDEILEGIMLFLAHAPAHCTEAARLGGFPTINPFIDDGNPNETNS